MKPEDTNLLAEVRLLRTRLTDLEEETRSLREKGKTASKAISRRRLGRIPRGVIGVVAVVIVATGLGTVYAADGNCPGGTNGLPFCFGPKTPAKASQVNHNFAMIKEWVEQKVGAVGDPDVTMQSDLAVTGTATAGAFATAGNVGAATVNATGNVSGGSLSTTGTVTAANVNASGTVYAGLYRQVCATPVYDLQDCACPANYKVLAGGAACLQGYLHENRAISDTTWRMRCASGENYEFPKFVKDMTLICARIGNAPPP